MDNSLRRQQCRERRVCRVWVEPYLAEYARSRFPGRNVGGGVVLSPGLAVYHVASGQMLHRRHCDGEREWNLLLAVPDRRAADGEPRRDPLYYNWVSAEGERRIGRALRDQFWYEVRSQLMANVAGGRPSDDAEVARGFLGRYGVRSLTEDAVLKDFQRYRRRISDCRRRKYQRRKRGRYANG